MTDHSVQDLLPDYAAGRLDVVTARGVEEHLAACHTCAAELELVRAIAAGREPVPAGLETRVRTAMNAAMDARAGHEEPTPVIRLQGRGRGWSWLLSPWTGVVTAALVAIVAGAIVFGGGPGTTAADADLMALGETAPYGALPGADGQLAGMALLDDLSEEQLEELLGELEL